MFLSVFDAFFCFILCFWCFFGQVHGFTSKMRTHVLGFARVVKGIKFFCVKKVVFLSIKMYALCKNNNLHFSLLFVLVFFMCMSAIRVCLKEELQHLKVTHQQNKMSCAWGSFGESTNTSTKNTLINKFKGTLIEGHTLEKMSIIKLVSASRKEGMLELDKVCLNSLWGLFSSHGY